MSRTVHWLPPLYSSRIHLRERDERVPRRSTPSASRPSHGHSSRHPSKIRHRESRPSPQAQGGAQASCSELSARTLTTRTFPRERWRHRYKDKLQQVRAYWQETKSTNAEK